MKKKLICLGNSHLAATKNVFKEISETNNLEPVFIITNWINTNDLANKIKGLAKDIPIELTVNDPSKAYSINIDPQESYAFLTSGAPFSGPGDFFRAIAKKSFTGSYDGIPSPAEVRCPWNIGPKSNNLDLEYGMLSSTCLRAIFYHYLSTTIFDNPLSKAMLELAQFRLVAHIPTPPMPENTVIHRFGRHVYESNLGYVMNRTWNNWVSEKTNRNLHLLAVPCKLVKEGWLSASATLDAGHPNFEIHANDDYGYAFSQELKEWLSNAPH